MLTQIGDDIFSLRNSLSNITLIIHDEVHKFSDSNLKAGD